MAQQISKADFSFKSSGYGCYEVTYQSPITRKTWSKKITDMTIIDATKNEDFPLKKDLNLLKSIVKS